MLVMCVKTPHEYTSRQRRMGERLRIQIRYNWMRIMHNYKLKLTWSSTILFRSKEVLVLKDGGGS